MASSSAPHQSIGRYGGILQNEPRVFVLDAGALLEAERPDEMVLCRLALLAESEQAQVVIRGERCALQQPLEEHLAAQRLRLQVRYTSPSEPLEHLLARLGVPASEALFFLAEAMPPPGGSHAFYVGSGPPPAGAVASRVPGPRGTDALLALYGTALLQEKAGLAFRTASLGEAAPAPARFDEGLFLGLIKSYGQPAGEMPTLRAQATGAPDLDGQLLRALVSKCFVRILGNILPNGAIVASPAKGERPGEPDYWFVWQRDAGYTLLGLIDWARSAPFGLATEPMRQAINSYLGFLTQCQASGNLGASRYTVEGRPVTGYGNPQLDGPAIGVLAMTSLLDPRPIYAQIRAALGYLLTPEGQGPCYDAWELVYGRILYTLLLKRKAFRAGAHLALVLTESADMRCYQDEAARLEEEIQAFIAAPRGYLVSNQEPADPWLATLSGLDVAALAAVLTGWDANDAFLNLTHPAVMGTVLALEDAFAPLYAVNRAWLATGHAGMGWGRFPEDANDGFGSTGGNPWPLATLWAAQYCYRLAEKLATGGPLAITDERQARYFNRVVGHEIASVGGQLAGQQVLIDLLPALRRRGDGYVQFVLAHQPLDGSVTEQINRDSGQPQGARDLTWAMSELLNTLAMRG